jgi:lipopolysaccharide transport system ATP-binding protein
MSCELAISARALSKTYLAYEHPLHALLARATGGRFGRHKSFHALRDVGFDVRKGESIGIIGRNGSGKSTLLQLICGIRKPTSGSVVVTGRISALLELGSGFHPEFSGRENVFMQGAILGLTRREMEARFDDITAFAEIGDYLDQPVKTYSSGMFVRLAFAVAISVDPEILIVDEALAVGDVQFQKRCYERLARMRKAGLTLLLVSHDHEMVRNLTERALLLDHGEVLAWGPTREVSRRYRKQIFEEEALYLARTDAGTLPQLPQPADPDLAGTSFGVGGANISSVAILDAGRGPRNVFEVGEPIIIELVTQITAPLDRLNFGVVIRTLEGLKVYSWGSFNQDIAIWAGRASGEVTWEKSFAAGDEAVVTLALEGNLGAGRYEVQAVVSRELQRQYGAQQVLHWRDEAGYLQIQASPASYTFGGVCDLHGRATIEIRQ